MDIKAVIFMPALAGAAILGFICLLFVAHYYLTVLEGTATGSKEVTWLSEPIIDNFWKLWYMLWLFGLWVGPGYLIARSVAAGTGSEWLKLWLPFAILWLLYPVSQLSSLSASTIWLPLVPDVFHRLAQKPAVTLGFYLLSIPVLGLLAVACKWAFFTKGEWELLFVGAPLVILALFLYARLIGRLAFVLAFTKSIFREKKPKKPKDDGAPKAREKNEDDPELVPTIRQPSDLPPIATIEGELTGYDVAFEDEPPRKKRVRAEIADAEPESRPLPPPLPPARSKAATPEPDSDSVDDEDGESGAYGIHAPESVPIDSTPRELVEPKEEEMRLLSRDDVPKQPTAAWGPELLAFLGQTGTISALVIASGICVLVGVFIRVARDFNPLE